jgi:hypothetical protein
MAMKNEKTDDPPKGSLNILRGLWFFEVGDAVYYKAPKPSYAVRKSTVVEVVTARCHHLAFPRVVYVLANGERLDQWYAYATRSLAEAAIIEELKSSIAFNKVWMTNLQHEIAYAQNFNQNGYVILCHRNRRCHWGIRVS